MSHDFVKQQPHVGPPLGIVCALRCEAQPLIAGLDMQRDFSVAGHELFRSEEAMLVVSGVGKVNSAIATTLLCVLSGAQQAPGCLLNIGVCGARAELLPGTMLLAAKIIDNASSRCFYPDVLLDLGLQESCLETFERPVLSADLLAPQAQIADMEAAGFMQAAGRYVPVNKAFVVKIVSDNFGQSELSAQYVKQLLESRLSDLITIADKVSAYSRVCLGGRLTSGQESQLAELCSRLRFSSAQRALLRQRAQAAAASNLGLERLASFSARKVSTKADARRAFEEVLRSLD